MSKQIDLEKLRARASGLPDSDGAIGPTWCTPTEVLDLLDHIAALEMDAARYQKLVQSGKFVPATLSPSCIWGLRTNGTHTTKQELDYAVDAIDTAMEASNA